MTISITQLRQFGLINVGYPKDLRAAVEHAVESWKRFCTLPKERKVKFEYANDTFGSGTGYELKEEKGSRKDLKENFQVTLLRLSRLLGIAEHEQDAQALRFIQDANTLIQLAEPVVLDFAKTIQESFGLKDLVQSVAEAKDRWILRYLHYFGDRAAGEEIAAAHADKCGFTLHLYESDAGLQYLDLKTRLWGEMPVDDGETVIIPSMQLQLQSEGHLKALYHRVVATEKTAKTGRYSMVCFIPLARTPLYNKDAYGRMHDFEPAFNYDIAHSEFARMFQ